MTRGRKFRSSAVETLRLMASKELKNELKSARESIQNKDYQAALKHCKNVLKLDRANYNAFVFIGVASFELGKTDQAQAAYKKAIEINLENILAWQGLASLYEKVQGIADKDDIINVYEKLIDYYHQSGSDQKKWANTVSKLADLYDELGNVDKSLELLLLLKDEESGQDEFATLEKVINLLQKYESNLTSSQRMELLNSYKNLLNSTSLAANDKTRQHFQNYINLIKSDMEQSTKVDMLNQSCRMKGFYKDDVFSREIMARVCLENIEPFRFQFVQSEPIGEAVDACVNDHIVYEELLALVPDSPLGLLVLGKVKLLEKAFLQAEKYLHDGLQRRPTSSCGWYYLANVQLLLHKYQLAQESAVKGLSCSKKEEFIYGDSNFVQFHLRLCRAQACANLTKDKISSAVEYFSEILQLRPTNVEVLCGLGRAYLKLNNLEAAKKCLEDSRIVDNVGTISRAFEGEINLAEGCYEKAEESFLCLIEVESDVASHYLNLGKTYWKIGGEGRNDKGKCLAQLLKAAKLDPYNSSTFLYLGHYYKTVSLDLSKACRCYKKAHELNPMCDEAGEALGDAYMTLDQEDEAVRLYKKFTVVAGTGRGKWSWLRLGLYYLKHEKHNDSVLCFQNALRVDVNDANSWECLSEAYMSRGSYTAALASFNRAVELDSTLLYSRYQIAAIKHLLGLLEEAESQYKEILAEHCDYVPALKGLGETFIAYARSSLAQDLHSKAVDYIQAGIVVFARAIEYNGKLSCLWKLLGDICTLTYKIHKHKIKLDLPQNLCDFLSLENVFDKLQALTLASSSYGQVVRFNPKCAGHWHDLGLSYFRLSSVHEDHSERQRFCERSIKALKKGLSFEPSNHNLWNTLGVVAASQEINNPELSQHAFIQSILSQKNAMAWTNLGVLYLLHGKADMANQAFNSAQCTDPSYTQAWIGQATIAEMFAHDESMDLYRHSNELGTHVEGYLGYAHWVCQTLLPENGQKSPVVKNKPFADLSHLPEKYKPVVLTASLALTKYTDQVHDNACAFNMHGILLEHQELYSQAEKAYNCSLSLLETSDEPNQTLCNIVRANYARVLCALCKYSESIRVYREIKPLDNFYHITGLALALFKADMLPDSFRAYEQAVEAATESSQQSHIRAAMGMLGYALKDLVGCKQILFESSQIEPASEEGLLALSAVGLITSDVSLAAAALSELVKIGQKGNESLIAQASYLFATFYAQQGKPAVGKNYITAEIHRRPHSSLLWNTLARFMLRYQPNNLKVVGQCAEAAHRLGDKNVKGILTTYSYATVGFGRCPVSTDNNRAHEDTDKLQCGIRAAQKAVHMQPDSLSNWALLVAALSDNLPRTGSSTNAVRLCEAVTHFALTKAFHDAKESQSRLGKLERRELDVIECTQKWLALQYGYCLYYSGKMEEAIKHCQQALDLWQTDARFCSRIQLLVVEIDCSQNKSPTPNILEDLLKVLALNQDRSYAWMFAGSYHEQHGLIQAAEYCYRTCLQLSRNQRLLHGELVSLMHLAHLALRQATSNEDEKARWLKLVLEATAEVNKCRPDFKSALLLQGIAHYLNNHIKQAKDGLTLISSSNCGYGLVAKYFLVLLNMKKTPKGQTKQDVMRNAVSENIGGPLQDLLLYALTTHFEGSERKRLLLECAHINPSEPRFREYLNKL